MTRPDDYDSSVRLVLPQRALQSRSLGTMSMQMLMLLLLRIPVRDAWPEAGERVKRPVDHKLRAGDCEAGLPTR
jgi:hypothetical protein